MQNNGSFEVSLATKGGIKKNNHILLRSITSIEVSNYLFEFIEIIRFVFMQNNDTSELSYVWKFSWDFLKLSSVSQYPASPQPAQGCIEFKNDSELKNTSLVP